MKRLAFALACLALPAAAPAQETMPLGQDLERFDYGAPVHWFEAEAQGHKVRMAWLDFPPAGQARVETLVLLHGKNFCAGTWVETARALSAQGWRVIVPDQIGFCKSSKPAGFQYSFAQLATLTRDLLQQAGVERPVLVGHSTGGMLALHHALLFPDQVKRLVLVNPLGLNDPIAEGAPYAPPGALLAEEAKTDAASIRAYQQRVYYGGDWTPEYQRWVDMLAGQYATGGGDRVRDAQARLSDMIQTQPTAHRLEQVTVPVTLIIGQEDLTAFRGNTAPDGVTIATVPQAAEAALKRFPRADLVEMAGVGHSPMVQRPEEFQWLLSEVLARQ
ncbi:alpha/beta hydrolase [Croceibacterium mercuriale]|uniref:Alpha/beta hydrolase n=1 Tax=Croceibacterium mercuriale TaxID=1572751 RepID=A0A0B2BZ80_9SPHN|nr:alpha/beta hydrolase [Croceibacterium mercuriale]KHL25322.1 alpha/beta hydrolase [Croceibacterium mercuriale]